MRGMLRALNGAANRHAGKLFLVGLAGVCWYNWRQWQRDRARLAALGEPEPLPPLEDWPALPRVSALVAAWKEADLIEAHIESFLGLRYPDKELVLCAGGEDGTYELAQRYAGPGVVVLEQRPGEGKQGALRRCFAQASGEIIFLTDADCVVDDEAFERTLAPVLVGSEVVATGSRRPLDEQLADPFVRYQWLYHAYCAARAPAYAGGLEGRNTAVARKVLDEAGGFEDQVAIGTDYYLARKLLALGIRIRHVPNSEVQTRHAASFGEYLQQQSRWQRNIILHAARFGAWPPVGTPVQRALVGVAMLGMPLLWLAGVHCLLPAWALLIVHGLLARLRYVGTAEHGNGSLPRLGQRPGRLLVYLFVDLIAWSAALVHLGSGRRRWQW